MVTPAAKSTVSSPVAFSGNATDDVSVTRVRVAVRNSVTTLWLQANGTWGSTIAQFDATLSSPGTTATGWTWVTALPAGSYYVQSKARRRQRQGRDDHQPLGGLHRRLTVRPERRTTTFEPATMPRWP